MTALPAHDEPTLKLPPEELPSPPAIVPRSQGMTDVGLVRAGNEDQFLIAELTKAMRVQQSSVHKAQTRYGTDRGYLFAVADGMGGHVGGQKASALAVQSLEAFVLDTFKWFFHLNDQREDGSPSIIAELKSGIERIDQRVIEMAARRPELHGMGTTLTMAYLIGRELYVVHVGDSRAYLLRQGTLYRLTRDHTLVEEMKDRGLLSAEEAAGHKLRNVITNVVGGGREGVTVEAHKLAVEPDDVLMLCTDGLHGAVDETTIATILQHETELSRACTRLIDEAKATGGRDNITVVVTRLEEPS